jgi:hypothetical protein
MVRGLNSSGSFVFVKVKVAVEVERGKALGAQLFRELRTPEG